MDWSDASEIVTGLLLSGKISVNAVRSELFLEPYNDIVKMLQAGDTEPEKIIQNIGLTPVQASIEAAKSLNGLSKQNWIKILEDTAISYQAGVKLEKLGKKLQRGENVDWAQAKSIINNAQINVGGDFIALSKVESVETFFKPTGFLPFDNHMAGFPQTGLVVCAAPPGTGKTTFLAQTAIAWAKTYPKEFVAIYTLEMMVTELKMRFKQLERNLPEKVADRILLNEHPVIPEEVISKAASIDNLGLVAIDFADLLVRGETTESAMGHIYRTFALGAKSLKCPILLLAQPNRSYGGGIPRPNHIRYTSLAEILAWQIIMLYNPAQDYFVQDDNSSNEILPVVDGYAYMIAWKCRGGFLKHKEDSPGAIQIPFKGSKGWNYKHAGRWFSLKKLS